MVGHEPGPSVPDSFPDHPPRARARTIRGRAGDDRPDRVARGGAHGVRLRSRRQGEAPLWSRGLPGLHRGRRDVSGQPQGVQSSTSCASGDSSTSARPTCPCVPEVAAGVAGRAPIIVDGGFRRGTDIFKALALGATAVGVGRPYIFGLAAFGQAGVETVLDILDSELRMLMRQAGTPSLAKITKAYVVDRSRRM